MRMTQNRAYLIKVMSDTLVEATSGGNSHGIIHVDNISFVPYHLQISLHTANTRKLTSIEVTSNGFCTDTLTSLDMDSQLESVKIALRQKFSQHVDQVLVI